MVDLHITLISSALAALITLWLGFRCIRARQKGRVLHGDGGDAVLLRRMRAQANFVEYTPFALILVGALELSGHGGWLLAGAALIFLAGRIVHALGMDSETVSPLRTIGMLATIIVLVALAIAALLAAFRVI